MSETEQRIKNIINREAARSQVIISQTYPLFMKVNLVVKVDFSLHRVADRGGLYAKGYGINMAAHKYLEGLKYYDKYPEDYIVKFHEYPSYQFNKVIGSAYVTDPWQYAALAVGHEVSHAGQKFLRDTKGIQDAPHGPLFKSLYSLIRTEINKELPNQVETKNRYNKFLLDAKKRELND